MSWLYSRALVEEYSEARCSDGEQSVPSNGMPTPQAYLCKDKTTAAWKRFPSGMTCKHLTDERGEEVLTWFLEDSHAKISAPQEKAQGSRESEAGCGRTWQESLAKYDLATCSWKTPQCSLLAGLDEFSGTWPRWGLMRDGVCWAQLMPVRRINEIESGLLPTPLATNGTNGGPNQRDSSGRPGLQMAAMMWPTPRAGKTTDEDEESWMIRKRAGKVATPPLTLAVKMWPTPTVQDSNKATKRWRDDHQNNQTAAIFKFPTPTCRDQKGGYRTEALTRKDGKSRAMDSLPNAVLGGKGIETEGGGQLNPTWVEWLMGWPLGWTDCAASAMDKFQQWYESHGKCCEMSEVAHG